MKFFKYLRETTVKEAVVKSLVAFAFFLDGNRTYLKIKRFFWRLMNDDNYTPKHIFDIFMLILVSISVGILLYDIKHQISTWLENFDFYFVTTIFTVEYLIRLWVYNDSRKIILDENEEARF